MIQDQRVGRQVGYRGSLYLVLLKNLCVGVLSLKYTQTGKALIPLTLSDGREGEGGGDSWSGGRAVSLHSPWMSGEEREVQYSRREGWLQTWNWWLGSP